MRLDARPGDATQSRTDAVLTLMVCTVLTGMHEMAMLEKMCPPTWKQPIGSVLLNTARVGVLKRAKRTAGLMNSRQYPATKPNCTNVSVIGKRNCVRIALPVFDESADVVYQSAQRSAKRSVEAEAADSGDGGGWRVSEPEPWRVCVSPPLQDERRRRRWRFMFLSRTAGPCSESMVSQGCLSPVPWTGSGLLEPETKLASQLLFLGSLPFS